MIRREVEGLPEALAEEVLDFIVFLKRRRSEERYLWAQVEEAQVYRRRNPQDVVTTTAEEWDEATGRLEPKEA
jgi:hypothetical protein